MPADQHSLLYDWQTLIAGLLAVLAAGFTAWLVSGQLVEQRRQVKLQREQFVEQRAVDDRRLKRQLRAARAVLPPILSEICEYAKDVSAGLATVYPEMPMTHSPIGRITFRRFPQEAVAVLQLNIESLDEGPVVERIASILREAQVLDARNRGLVAEGHADRDMIGACLNQCVSIYARAESLFDFARGHGDDLGPDDLWEAAFRAFDLLNIRRGRFDDVLQMARQDRERGSTPGEADERGTG